MKVLVFGANGKTGRTVVERAAAAGHEVTAFVRSSEQSPAANVKLAQGDATSRADVDAAMQGQEAVIDTIGGKTPYKDTGLESSAAATIIASMRANGVRRLIATSMLGVGDSKENAPLYARLLVSTFLRGADRDKATMEAEVVASRLDWTILRPAILSDGEATGDVQVVPEGADAKAHKITRADVAEFMVQQLSATTYLNQSIVIANS